MKPPSMILNLKKLGKVSKEYNMAWEENLFGSKDKIIKSPVNTKSQQALIDQIMQILGPALQNQQGFLQNPQQNPNLKFNFNPQGNQLDFAGVEKLAYANYDKKAVPSIMERFTSGGGSSRGNSQVYNQLAEGRSGLEEALAALKFKYGFLQNQQNDQNRLAAAQGQFAAGQFNQQQGFNNRNQQLTALQNFFSHGLAPQFQNNVQAGQAGLFPTAGKAIATALPYAAGAYFGGPAGAMALGGAANAYTNYNQAVKAGVV